MKIKSLRVLPKSIQHTMIYGVSIALMKSISLIMLPIVAHYLTPSQFGQLELLTSIGVVFSILVGLGLESTLFRFAGSESNEVKKKRIAGGVLTLTLISGALAALAGWLIAPIALAQFGLPVSALQLRLVLLVIAFEGAIAIPLAWLRMREQVTTFFMLTCTRTLLQALLIIAFLRLGLAVDGVLLACFLAAFIQGAYLTYVMFKETGLRWIGAQSYVFIRYSIPIVGSGLIAFSLAGLDRWLLADFGSLTDVAIYGVAAKFALATVLLVQPFGMWWLPKRFTLLQEHGGQERIALYTSMGIVFVLVVAVVVTFIAPLLIQWLLPKEYYSAIEYIAFLVLAMAFKEISELVNIGCFVGETTRCQFLISLVTAIIGVVSMWLWIPTYGIWGVVIGLNCAYFTQVLLFFLLSQYYLPLPYAMTKIISIALLCLVIVYSLQLITINLFSVVITSLLMLVAIAVSIYFISQARYQALVQFFILPNTSSKS
ncbi:lipopolysaccharide biosynthesis protein [Psychrobium sp. 1_MG-2023]|uniref:lipopolysaccharide biosynthesis protein n=1 Tax=Psychrobium sp. 1_MG-2023 TaxID=3062624 RepID=UPI000C31CB7B|nr:oligosaccharide flippase family protein [Psychrobium sp. 1_MG-2023]MDP2561327.1 oligosaccharide flippase family protein [Psychrobium sp. 1_MG-2023]PKF54141.1 oligosaccharide translocase [Alteromonadales bacterium alter-6D02]